MQAGREEALRRPWRFWWAIAAWHSPLASGSPAITFNSAGSPGLGATLALGLPFPTTRGRQLTKRKRGPTGPNPAPVRLGWRAAAPGHCGRTYIQPSETGGSCDLDSVQSNALRLTHGWPDGEILVPAGKTPGARTQLWGCGVSGLPGVGAGMAETSVDCLVGNAGVGLLSAGVPSDTG